MSDVFARPASKSIEMKRSVLSQNFVIVEIETI
jgi:hypothetical protein